MSDEKKVLPLKFTFFTKDGEMKAVPFDEELQVTVQFDSKEERDYVTREIVTCGWHKCSEGLPYEHDSLFKKFKGTDMWRDGMYETLSDLVDVTVLHPDGTRRTATGWTAEGVWHTNMGDLEKGTVIAWRHRPAPYGGEV